MFNRRMKHLDLRHQATARSHERRETSPRDCSHRERRAAGRVQLGRREILTAVPKIALRETLARSCGNPAAKKCERNVRCRQQREEEKIREGGRRRRNGGGEEERGDGETDRGGGAGGDGGEKK